MTVLVSALSGDGPPPIVQQPPPVVQQPQPTEETAMEVGTDQGDGEMTDGTRAQQLGSKGLTEDANAT